MYRLDLQAQIIWHRRTVCFVLWVDVIAEGLALGIKYHHQGALGIVFLQPAHHIDDPFYRTCRFAFAVGKRWQCMKGSVEV